MSVHCKTQSLIYFMSTATDSDANTKDDTTLKRFCGQARWLINGYTQKH